MQGGNDKRRRLSCPLYNFVVKEEYIYSFSWTYNCFFKINMKSGEIESRQTIKDYSGNSVMLFRLIDVDEGVIAFPYSGNCILKWKTDSMRFEKISLPLPFSEDRFLRKFSTYVKRENEILFFPADISYIYQLDIKTNVVAEVLNIRECLANKYGEQAGFLFVNGCHLAGNQVYLGCWEINAVVKYDICMKKVEFIQVEGVDSGIRSICGNRDRIYILTDDARVVMWEIGKADTTIVSVADEGERQFWGNGEDRLFYYDGYIFVFDGNIELSKRIRISDLQVEILFDQQCVMQMKKNYPENQLFFGTFKNGLIYIYSAMGDIYWYDAITKENVGSVHLQYDVEELAQWIRKNAKSISYVREDEYLYGLSDLVKLVTKSL